jgi:type III secretory pathway component EscV
LIYRWSFNDKSKNISILKKQITNPEFLAWVDAFDKKDFKQFKKDNLEPFENIFLRLGVLVLQNASNYLAANPSKTVQDIKTDLAQLIRDLQTKGDPVTIQKLEQELRRIQKLGGFDTIVPAEGVVFVYGGHTYKMTGAFAPVNQILGVLKYTR